MQKVQTLKGFRDFLPEKMKKRQYVISTLRKVFESYGFEPLETPALEYEEILLGKYGDEGDKLMYRFVDNGGRRVALRYDQTVPLARVVTQYANELSFPFKRYQIQPVWRADNTQKGRFREFLQCDIDTIGTSSLLADAEIIATVDAVLKKLGFRDFKIKINSRELLFKKIKEAGIPESLTASTIRIIDKIEKIGWNRIVEELINIGIDQKSASSLENLLSLRQPQEDPTINELFKMCLTLGVNSLDIDLTLARGLDYYTGLIFEVSIPGYSAGSVCGGGRYDGLIGMFANKQIPAVGCAFGFDRIVESMDELNLFPQTLDQSSVLVTIFNLKLADKATEVAQKLRENGVNTELWLDANSKIDKQLKYADQKGIRYAIIIGPEEAEKNVVTVKDLKTREQKQVSLTDLPNALT